MKTPLVAGVLSALFVFSMAASLAFAQAEGIVEGEDHMGRNTGDEGNASPPHYMDRQPQYSIPNIQRHASTATEGYLRGSADYVRGLGDLQYSMSAARLNNQAAINYYYDNRREQLESVAYYLQMREYLRQYRRGRRPTAEKLTELAKNRAPDPLTDQEFDQSTGTLYWPAVLQDAVFAGERSTLDYLFAQRKRWPRESGIGTENARAIREATAAMKLLLKDRIDNITPTEYVVAKKYLNAVELESLKPAGTQNSYYSMSN